MESSNQFVVKAETGMSEKMKKKKYESYMEEYQRIIQDKKYNPKFHDGNRLEELKTILSRELGSLIVKNSRQATSYRFHGWNCWNLEYLEYLRELEHAIFINSSLLTMIMCEESIEKHDYHDGLISKRFWFLYVKQLFVDCFGRVALAALIVLILAWLVN